MTIAEFERIRKLYDGGHFTALWSDNVAGRQAEKAAAEILRAARERCFDEDVRDETTGQALAFLEARGYGPAVRKFRAALDIIDPYERDYATALALRGFKDCG